MHCINAEEAWGCQSGFEQGGFLMPPSTAADLMETRVDADSSALVLSGFEIHGLPVFVTKLLSLLKQAA